MKPLFFELFSLAERRELPRILRFTARGVPKTRATSALCVEEGKVGCGTAGQKTQKRTLPPGQDAQ